MASGHVEIMPAGAGVGCARSAPASCAASPSWHAGLAGCGGGGAGAGQYPRPCRARRPAQYPSFLPKKTLDPTVDATLIGTEAKPALQTEGLAIEAKTKAFHVDVTVSGPIVPGEGLPDQPAATTCTWTVTMKNATADVPVSIADFHSVDHLGSVFLMGLVPGEHPPPPVLHPGQTLISSSAPTSWWARA